MFSHKELINKTGVYKITNLVNNKIYIGSSCSSLYKRMITHLENLRKNKHTNIYLQNSWNKYGEENFKFEVLEICVGKDVILKQEEFYINFFDSVNKGYNIFQFAHTTNGNRWSEEARIRRKGFGKGIPNSEETRRKISMSNKGRIISEATRQKLSNLHLRSIVMLNLDGSYVREFKSPTEAAHFFNLYDATWLYLILRGKKKTCNGYRLIFKDEYDPNSIQRIVAGDTVEINQYDLEGNFIKTFLSLKEAEMEIGRKGCSANISACCRGRRKNAYGFIWKYKNE